MQYMSFFNRQMKLFISSPKRKHTVPPRPKTKRGRFQHIVTWGPNLRKLNSTIGYEHL